MLDRLFNSIVFRIGGMMFLISFVSIISMFSSVFVSELADQDALVINEAGSLRKLSYKIFAELELINHVTPLAVASVQAKLNNTITEFSQKVNAPVMNSKSDLIGKIPVNTTLESIRKSWFNELEPQLRTLTENPQLLTSETLVYLNSTIENFVVRVDNLVSLYQHRAENRILLIRMILGVSLLITTLVAALTMFQISRKIERPLSELTSSARKIIAGDYTAMTNIQQNDELGLLAETMNKMSKVLSYSYGELEKRVQVKTAKLRRTNDSLELLYQTSQLINQSDTRLDLRPITEKLAAITNKPDLDLCLTTGNANLPYEHIITKDHVFKDKCLERDCIDCLHSDKKQAEINNGSVMRYPIIKDENSYGVLVCNLDKDTPLESWQHQLFSSIATLIANGLHIHQQNEQSRRITLLNERNVIARELHDSLAQALSYLKIQVTRLQKLKQRDASEEQIEDVILELKTGLNSAYRQLRELLTTFRLRIDEEGLQHTFLRTIEQLNERAAGNMTFHLNYQIQNLPLTPNEEIHLMQIAREATQNALNHSQAENIYITVFSDENKKIHLLIEDDGVGMPSDPSKLNHYGLAIMQERSHNLEGEITIKPIDTGGTRVELIFTPNFSRELESVA